MPHVTIEYTILLPMLILQIFLFPITAGLLMDIWVDQRQSLALQDASNHLGSTIQQLYFSLNHETISTGTVTYETELPMTIENHWYIGNATLKNAIAGQSNPTKILAITLILANTRAKITTSVILGPNALWKPSIFRSNSTTYSSVSAFKNSTGITLMFGE